MSEKLMLVDLSKCTGCRACQVACKNWNGLPAENTRCTGTYQNPPDLSPHTYTLIRFQEIDDGKGGLKWLFRNDKCFHCADPGCMKACPVPGCIYKTPEGAVIIDSKKCIGCKYCYHACPFSIPQYDEASEKVFKCTMCADRVADGLIPACAKACPTGAIAFGDKGGMLQKAHARAQELGGTASVYGDQFVGGTHVVYVLTEPPAAYEKLPEKPQISSAVTLWKDCLKPLSMISLLGGIGASFLYYITKGPKNPDFEEGGKNDE
ncbi:MAG: 4Fe-4S dicluster domain-containing protein [Deltaproteobacteria bacterium]|nr:4Fe-4S dicluster domain-containing protein [Deltaproteobacteria bacterium]